MKMILNFLLPLLVFFLWVRPSTEVVGLVFSQTMALTLFYLPFWWVARALVGKSGGALRDLSLAFAVVFAGAFSFVVTDFSIPQFSAWLALFVIAVSVVLFKRQKWEFKNVTHWEAVLFFSLLIWNLFSSAQIGPFYSPIGCDTSLLHLSLPKVYSANQGWVNPWWLRAPFAPQLMQRQYALQMTFAKQLGLRADLLPVLTGLVLFISMIQSSGVFLGKKWRWWFGCALLCLSCTRLHLGVLFMDLPETAMVIAFAASLYLAFLTPTLASGTLVGILLVASLGVKHMSLFFTLPLFLIWFAGRKRLDWSWIFGVVLGSAPLFVLIFFRNWQLTGNPLFPFLFASHPDGFHWTPADLDGFRSTIRYLLHDPTVKGLVKSFFKIQMDPAAYTDTYGYGLGYLFTACALCVGGAIYKKRTLIIPALALFVIFCIQYSSWYFGSPVVRYLYPLAGLLILATLYFVQSANSKFISYFSVLIFGLVLIQSQRQWLSGPPALPPVTYAETQKFYRENTKHYRAFEWLDTHSPLGSLVYTYGGSCEWLQSPRPFFGDWFGDTHYGILSAGTPAEIKAFLLREQPDYVLEELGNGLRRLESLPLFNLCLDKAPLYQDSGARIYKMNYSVDCPVPQSSAARETIRFQPQGLDFFFRR